LYPTYSIMLIGSKEESAYVSDIFEKITNKEMVYNLSGTTSINELISIIGHARLMITNDTGPMHIGFCTNTPIVALFGPCLPNQYGNNKKSVIIHKDVYCSPCVHEFIMPPCKGNNTCMKSITMTELLDAAVGVLHKGFINHIPQKPILYLNNKEALGMVNRAR
jgi:ADP-heptose:LPS heptosyltransferase